MIRVDRGLLAWIVSVGVCGLAVAIAVRAVWPGVSDVFSSSGGGGFAAASVAFPSLVSLPVVVGNLVLSVIARRRGGRAASIGSICLWTVWILVIASLVGSLTPPAVAQSMNGVLFLVLFLLLALGTSLPTQLLILAVLTFMLIGPRTQRAAGDMR
jgi:FtsH-binding integral membrane protein